MATSLWGNGENSDVCIKVRHRQGAGRGDGKSGFLFDAVAFFLHLSFGNHVVVTFFFFFLSLSAGSAQHGVTVCQPSTTVYGLPIRGGASWHLLILQSCN